MPYHLEKSTWSGADFDLMGWHDNRIYSLAFLPEEYQLRLDIDYIFEWVESNDGNRFESFWVAPSTLCFENVSNIKFDIDMGQYYDLDISEIRRELLGKTPNGKYDSWRYTIETGVGSISLEATNYKMYVRAHPINSESQDIPTRRGGISIEIT